MDLPINYEKSGWIARKKAREQYIKEQCNKCHHCGESLFGKPSMAAMLKPINAAMFPKHMFKHPVHLHHCRKTGMTIGALHSRCNAYLWQYHGE